MLGCPIPYACCPMLYMYYLEENEIILFSCLPMRAWHNRLFPKAEKKGMPAMPFHLLPLPIYHKLTT